MMFICVHVLSVYPSVCLSVCLSFFLHSCTRLHVLMLFCLSVWMYAGCQPVFLSVCLPFLYIHPDLEAQHQRVLCLCVCTGACVLICCKWGRAWICACILLAYCTPFVCMRVSDIRTQYTHDCMHACSSKSKHAQTHLQTYKNSKHPYHQHFVLSKPTPQKVKKDGYIQPVAFAVSFNLNLKSQSIWSLFNGTMRRRRRELDNRLSFEIGEMTHPNLIGCIWIAIGFIWNGTKDLGRQWSGTVSWVLRD